MDPWLEVQMSDDEREYNKKHAAPAPAPEPPTGTPRCEKHDKPMSEQKLLSVRKKGDVAKQVPTGAYRCWDCELEDSAAAPTGTGEGSENAALRSQLATAQARIATLENNVQNWRAGLLDAWANDYRATMTALLESDPLAEPPSGEKK